MWMGGKVISKVKDKDNNYNIRQFNELQLGIIVLQEYIY